MPKVDGRDIQSMINSLGHPIPRIPSGHGYMYPEPFTPVLSPAMTDAALTRVCIALLAI